MFIVKSLVKEIQSQFSKNVGRSHLFTTTLLSIILPVTGSRSSQLLRTLTTLFEITITQRRFYIFMASPKFPWEALWQCLWRLIPSPLTDGRLILAADDSMSPKTGKKIYGCDYHFDHAAKMNQSHHVWSQNIVQVGLLKWIHGRYVCLPLSWCFYQLQKTCPEGFQTKLEQVEKMVCSIHKVFKQPILLVADSWFSAKTLVTPLRHQLGNDFHFLSRLRTNTKLYDTIIPAYSGRGRPRKYGLCLGNTKELGERYRKKSQCYSTFLYGKQRQFNAASDVFFLKSLGIKVNVVWVFYKKQTVVFFTTDLSLGVEKIIEYYSARWKIESGFKELKQEIGSRQTQARCQQAVINHLHFCMMAVTFIWIYADRLPNPVQRRYNSSCRNAFAFSDVRYALSQQIAHEDFLKVLFNSHKSHKNKLISTFLKIAA